MGCDIHGAIEYKSKDIGGYKCVLRSVNLGRSYKLFSALCGVRSRDGKRP